MSKSFFDDVYDNKLLFDKEGVLWVGTYQGLVIVHPTGVIELLQADLDNKSSLSKNSIKSLFEDEKGSVWVGTYYGGVNIWDASNINFQSITQNQKGKGLNYTVVSSVESYDNYMFFLFRTLTDYPKCDLIQNQVWRLYTNSFIHFDINHITGNILFLIVNE